MWAQFKHIFTTVHQDLQESKSTVKTIEYTKNTTQEVKAFEAITQLANVTTIDCFTIASLM